MNERQPGVGSARAAALALLAGRSSDATVCPSEVARTLVTAVEAGSTHSAWRDLMPAVHAAVDTLLAEGQVRLSWKGTDLPKRAGPYRIRRGV